MIKILSVIGARPQIIKSAAINRTIKNKYSTKIQEIIVHTGQHYDDNMSEFFFKELDINKPKYNLGIGSNSHGLQTAKMIEDLESIILNEKPDCILLYGDTNSTLAGAVAASKLKIPIAHIEAGLRSYNKTMPEEINRVVCDHVSTFLFSPTQTGINNLIKEGFRENTSPYHIDNPALILSGDVMYDNSIHFLETAKLKSKILEENKLSSKNYILATIHRENNTDDLNRLENIFKAFLEIFDKYSIPIIIPIHPRTLKTITKLDKKLYHTITNNTGIMLISPVSFFDITVLENNAKIIITDSGGVQKEAYFYKVPSIILRNETEWVEIIENMAGKLVDADIDKILNAVGNFIQSSEVHFKSLFGEGNASEIICAELLKELD